MFKEKILTQLTNVVERFGNSRAFCVSGKFYTYKDFAQAVSKIRAALQLTASDSHNVGLVTDDDMETYASIFALWLEGKSYVPLNPKFPEERNLAVVDQAEIEVVIDVSGRSLFKNLKIINTKKLPETEINLTPEDIADNQIAYIFFTSGSTGTPKGVPISRGNLSGFVEAFERMGLKIDENDRVLQMFELTFDLSVFSYLIPLLKGACVYTIPSDAIKFNYVFDLMEDHKLTVALMVPSILHYIRPYFDELDFPDLKYSLFCGEALPDDLTEGWSACVPNAEIYNVYGPTENTIFCTSYLYGREKENKSYNNILSIGKPMAGTQIMIVDEENHQVSVGEKGELCLSGVQLTPGYIKNDKKNQETFFYKEYNGKEIRFYKTGDLCYMDGDGDIIYVGRIDYQVKVQGYRVELGEIEHYARMLLNGENAVAVAFENRAGSTEIILFIEGKNKDTGSLAEQLKKKLPPYMVPASIFTVASFPLNASGKIDRLALKQKLTTDTKSNTNS